eukprot:TRINITY_DN14619_c0_g1_i2.p1 TRINITY_DN14619_c0_g1~~TRINITY_DN14619_c0_g1_i2.p1  ORF type:complete len:398 (+),score=65.31 TRINITY_DN14619_c0_g1_i2:63-1256(+)
MIAAADAAAPATARPAADAGRPRAVRMDIPADPPKSSRSAFPRKAPGRMSKGSARPGPLSRELPASAPAVGRWSSGGAGSPRERAVPQSARRSTSRSGADAVAARARRSAGGRSSTCPDTARGSPFSSLRLAGRCASVVDSTRMLRITPIVSSAALAQRMRRTSTDTPSSPLGDGSLQASPLGESAGFVPVAGLQRLESALSLCHCPGKKLQQGRDGKEHRRDLAADIASLRERGTTVIWCLLNDSELRTLGVPPKLYEQVAAKHGITLRRYPLVEMTPPASVQEFDGACMDPLYQTVFEDGGHVVVHCRGGVGRAGLVAACLLLRAGLVETHGPAAVAAVRKLRDPRAVESQTQRAFVGRYADWCAQGRQPTADAACAAAEPAVCAEVPTEQGCCD